jgi:hypothetical protein
MHVITLSSLTAWSGNHPGEGQHALSLSDADFERIRQAFLQDCG